MRSPVLTTGVGSLPFARHDEALRHVFARYSLPFYPQLPQAAASGSAGPRLPQMLRETLTPGMLAALGRRDGTSAIMLLERAAETGVAVAGEHAATMPGMSDFLERAVDTPAVKIQLVGPVTAAMLLCQALPDVPPAIIEHCAHDWIITLTRAVIDHVAGATRGDVYFTWDDGAFAPQAGRPLRERHAELVLGLPARVRFGLHDCTGGSIEPMVSLAPPLTLWVDASAVDFASADVAAAARQHLGRGGTFVFGVFDTRETRIHADSGLERAQLVAALVRESGASGPVILSGGCGTGLHQPLFEDALAESLQAAAALISV